MDDDLAHEIVTAATQAPSVHNTQPWLFTTDGDVLTVRADPARRLPVLDPAGRALHLSCGAALALAEVYVRSRGLACAVTLLPDPADTDRLADLQIGPAAGAQDTDLAAVIAGRHTDRRPFDPRPVPPGLLGTLAAAAEHEGCWLRVLSSTDDVAALAVTLARAEEELAADPAYRDELQRWTGRTGSDTDGVPASAVPGRHATRASSLRLRNWQPGDDEEPPPAEPPAPEHPSVVVLGTVDDDPAAWLRAGRALGRVLLTAAAGGLACSPMTQALEVEGTRTRLAYDLGVLGSPQMVLRVGFPDAAPAPAPSRRRAVDEVLTRG